VLVAVGWILLATQPGDGWHGGQFVSWSHDVGLMGLIHSLALWHGVLAFGVGVVLGSCLDAVPVAAAAPVAAARPARTPMTDREQTLVQPAPADEALTAEQREAAYRAEPNTVTVGPHSSDE
jgi:hypothetical protein